MNLFFRFFFLLMRRFFERSQQSLLDVCSTSFRVGFLDLDINAHMNNGRYLSLMDLGRVDLMLKTGFFWPLILNGFFPVVLSESIVFRRSLGVWQKFEIQTEVIGWDEKDFFIVQRFICRGQTYATGHIRGRFLKRGQRFSVPTLDLFRFLKLPWSELRSSDLGQLQKSIDEKLMNHFSRTC
ncbi:MAG: thioesterase family protein [Bdellovibrio sp.]